MEVHYNRWFRQHKKAVAGWERAIAIELHESRKPYCVILGDINNPFCFLEINNSFVYVGFLDEKKREITKYEYHEVELNKLFLKEIQTWEYEKNSDERYLSVRYRFTIDGNFSKSITNLRNKKSEKFQIKEKLSIDSNYVNYPKFGEYSNLITKDVVNLIDLNKKLPPIEFLDIF